MATAEEALRRYNTSFQRHLSFFDQNGDGFIHFGECLRGNLAIGLDFPVAVGMTLVYHVAYGNTRPFFFGPFNPIEVARVKSERNMLEHVRLNEVPAAGMGRSALVSSAQPAGLVDRTHVYGLWAITADRQGNISPNDIKMYQEGTMLYDLAKRRRDNRDHVLPLYRGGPISVAGHSWFVDKLFGVKVYQLPDENKSK
ncbi:hypothetical protein LTR70_000294 [Exophiala xenobiotica]|uniref:EF-hand domain-containing protein n=1 Tax=Lithohypha guttulata TaxID=1690604 RepID=A0ABR0K5C7_9EURO|nr:hypothetical protein LTR24_006731 [Lithohypha guttulata]KAK5330972.1 hypothetical protein LTR70_000294 [Exophiala xenobiotica]